jgi:hypothetical protein
MPAENGKSAHPQLLDAWHLFTKLFLRWNRPLSQRFRRRKPQNAHLADGAAGDCPTNPTLHTQNWAPIRDFAAALVITARPPRAGSTAEKIKAG